MLNDQASIREFPARSTVVQHCELGAATYERIRAEEGHFSATYAEYAIVFATGPVLGDVTLNGSRWQRSSETCPIYSVLTPGDNVVGVLEKPTTYEILLLTASYVNELLGREESVGGVVICPKLRVAAPRALQILWKRIGSLFARPLSLIDQSRVMLCLELLLLNIAEEFTASARDVLQRQHKEALSRAAQFIEGHLGDPLKLSSIAKVAGMSAAHFNRIFKAHHHVPVHRFVLQRRLERVRQLLRDTERPIAALALDAGFSSQSHLTYTFGRHYAMTPAQYRVDARRTHGRRPE